MEIWLPKRVGSDIPTWPELQELHQRGGWVARSCGKHTVDGRIRVIHSRGMGGAELGQIVLECCQRQSRGY